MLDRFLGGNIQFTEEVSCGFSFTQCIFAPGGEYLGLVISSVYLSSLLLKSTFEMVYHAYCAISIYSKNEIRTFLDLV